jgi:lysozyme family protein
VFYVNVKGGFQTAIELELQLEGGYVDDPRDTGGITNQGITQRAVVVLDFNGDGILDFDFDGDGDVDRDDMLQIPQHPRERDAFYRHMYWDVMHGDQLWWPLSLLAFDAAIQHGPDTATRLMQRALSMGLKVDGDIGTKTLTATEHCDPEMTVRRYFVQRHTLYGRICWRRAVSKMRGRQATPQVLEEAQAYGYCYLAGWTSRLETVHHTAYFEKRAA